MTIGLSNVEVIVDLDKSHYGEVTREVKEYAFIYLSLKNEGQKERETRLCR